MNEPAVIERLLGEEPERAATVLALVFARTLPLAFLAPWLGWRGTAGLSRLAVAAVLALALAPLAGTHVEAVPAPWVALGLALVREALVGATFAIAVSAPLYAMGWTGDLVERWRGSAASMTTGDSPLGTLHLTASVVLFVLLGGHRLAITAFAEGLADLPAGATVGAESLGALALGSGRIVAHALALTVAFLTPAAIAFVVLELGLALGHRVAPAFRAWLDAMPLRAALGLAVALLSLVALLPRLGPVFEASVDAARELLSGT